MTAAPHDRPARPARTMPMTQVRELELGARLLFTSGAVAELVAVQGRGMPFHSIYYKIRFESGEVILVRPDYLKGRLVV